MSRWWSLVMAALMAATMGCNSSAGETNPEEEGETIDDDWRGNEIAAIADGRWSNPSTWDGRVPEAGDVVTIPAGTTVYLDTETAPLYSLDVAGTLEADPVDVALTAETIRVTGLLQAGTEDERFESRFVITLTGQSGGSTTELEQGIGRRVLAVLPGGRLELHGLEATSWTQLSETADAGATSITVDNADGWTVGDRIALTPSDYVWDEVDERTITGIDGNTLQLDAALTYYHFGELQMIEGIEVDERAEVALLSHNILVQGEEASLETFRGGHMIFLDGSTVHLESIEVTRMGQRGVLGRYPIHWHLARDGSGDYVRDSAVHHNFQRSFTIHTTDNLEIADNVAYDTFGHAFFFEDAVETGNRLLRNLGAMVRRLPEEHRVENPDLDDDHKDRFDAKHDRRSSVFWITSPANYFEGNVAAGAEHGMGFWFDLIRGEDDETMEEIDLRHEPLLSFVGNVAHSISTNNGNNMGYGPLQAGSGLSFESIFTIDEDAGEPIIEDFMAYKCRNHGIWGEGSQTIDGAILVGNRVAIQNNHFSRIMLVRNSLVVGDSANRPTDASNISRSPFTGTFQGPMGVAYLKGATALESVTFVNFPGTEDDQNVVWRVQGQYSKYAHWVDGVRFVDAHPITHYDRDEGALLVFNDLSGDFLGEPGAIIDGSNSEFGQTEACSVMGEDYGDLMFCPYNVLRPSISGRRGSSTAAGIYFERPDGVTDDARASDDNEANQIVPSQEHTVVHGINTSNGRFSLRGNGAPSLWAILEFPSELRYGFYDNPDRSGDQPVLDDPVQTFGSMDELLASTTEGFFVDDASGTTYVRLHGDSHFLICDNAECDTP